MKEEEVQYAIDRYHGKMTVYYNNKVVKTVILHKNMDYNEENQKLAEEIVKKWKDENTI